MMCHKSAKVIEATRMLTTDMLHADENAPNADMQAKEKKPHAFSLFNRVAKDLSFTATQKLLYLELLYTILESYPERTNSPHASPTSPYFFDGQRAPLKHASLILRIIRKKKMPTIQLRQKRADQIANILLILYNSAMKVITHEDECPENVKKQALNFVQLSIQVEKLSHSVQNSDPTFFPTPKESALNRLYQMAFDFGVEYYTFCLERI